MDFASISAIILDNLCTEGMTNAEYYYGLFFYAFEQDQYKITEPDNGDISRYLNGQRGIPKDIIRLYQTDEKFGYLRKGMANVLSSAVDQEYVKEQVYTLLQGDVTISLLQRKEFAGYMQETDMFLSRCLLFGMTRKFVPKSKEKKADSTIVISDFLLDYQIPSVGKVFLGRDMEIESIYRNIEVDDITSACLFMESTINYLEKYNNIDGMVQVLDIMERYIQLGNQHRRETATYYCYRGGVELRRGNTSNAIRLFQNGIRYAEPVDKKYAELASNLNCNLGSCYLNSANIRLGKESIMKALDTRKLYQLPFNQNSLILTMYYVQILALSGKISEAILYLSACISLLECTTPEMQVAIGELYYLKGTIEKAVINLPDAKTDFEKAKKCWKGRLPQDDRRIQELDFLSRIQIVRLPDKS